MAKRFTDTTKWEDSWFRKLPSKFKVAWEFDRIKAVEVAQKIAAEAIENPYYALNGALDIALQAGIPEAKQVYEKGIERLEKNGALDLALEYLLQLSIDISSFCLFKFV